MLYHSSYTAHNLQGQCRLEYFDLSYVISLKLSEVPLALERRVRQHVFYESLGYIDMH